MARRKPRRNVGPQPHHNPKRAMAEAAGTATKAAPKRKPGEPHPPSFRGVAIRAAIVAAIFYPYLVYIVGEDPLGALLISLVAFALMLPLGMVMDRFRYRRQLARWQERRGRPRSAA